MGQASVNSDEKEYNNAMEATLLRHTNQSFEEAEIYDGNPEVITRPASTLLG